MSSIEKLIRDAVSKSIVEGVRAAESGEIEKKNKWIQRVKYLRRIQNRIEYGRFGYALPKTAFVAYSKKSGKRIFDILVKELEHEGFEVLTGFDDSDKNDGTTVTGMLKSIKHNMQKGVVYIGILTREYRFGPNLWSPGSMDPSFRNFSPSIWISIENGMAAYRGMPMLLLIQEGIDSDFWEIPFKSEKHHMFNMQSAKDVCEKIAKIASGKYEENAFDRLNRI